MKDRFYEFQDKMTKQVKAMQKIVNNYSNKGNDRMCLDLNYCVTVIRSCLIPSLEDAVLAKPNRDDVKNLLLNIDKGLNSMDDMYEKILLISYSDSLEAELEKQEETND